MRQCCMVSGIVKNRCKWVPALLVAVFLLIVPIAAAGASTGFAPGSLGFGLSVRSVRLHWDQFDIEREQRLSLPSVYGEYRGAGWSLGPGTIIPHIGLDAGVVSGARYRFGNGGLQKLNMSGVYTGGSIVLAGGGAYAVHRGAGRIALSIAPTAEWVDFVRSEASLSPVRSFLAIGARAETRAGVALSETFALEARVSAAYYPVGVVRGEHADFLRGMTLAAGLSLTVEL